MNIALWIGACALALGFAFSGAGKLAQTREKVIAGGSQWAEDFSQPQLKLIGTAEVLGAIGLIVPAALDIASVMSAAAAAGLAIVMTGAVIVHLRREEARFVGLTVPIAVLCAALAVLRFGPYAF